MMMSEYFGKRIKNNNNLYLCCAFFIFFLFPINLYMQINSKERVYIIKDNLYISPSPQNQRQANIMSAHCAPENRIRGACWRYKSKLELHPACEPQPTHQHSYQLRRLMGFLTATTTEYGSNMEKFLCDRLVARPDATHLPAV